MDELHEYAEYLSDILQMKAPLLKVISKQEMESLCGDKETLAAYDRSTKTIFVIEKSEYTLMDYYLLSHEFRHAWQDIEDPVYYFKDYDLLSKDEYNNSEAEIDANAFACIAMVIGFGKVTKRTYKNDKEAQEKYDKRLEELKRQFDIAF